jgi:ribosome maturation factor RimP
MTEMSDAQILTLVTAVVEKHGCKLIDVDLENHIINLEGSDDAKVKCAIALEEVLADM